MILDCIGECRRLDAACAGVCELFPKEKGRVKIGAENKKELITMVVLLLIAVPAIIYAFRSINGSQPAAAAAPRPAAAPATQKKTGVQSFQQASLDTTLRTDVLAEASKIRYDGSKRNIFRMEEPPPPPPPKPVAPVVTGPPAPPPPPPPPPIPLKYFGFSNKPGEPKKAFLSEGDDIFVAKEGDVVDRRFKVLQISNTSVLIEDVLNNNKQPIPLTAPGPGPTG